MNPPATLLDLLQLAPGNRTAIIVPELNLRITYDALRPGEVDIAELPAQEPAAPAADGERIARLESEIESLKAEIAELRNDFREFQKQFD